MGIRFGSKLLFLFVCTTVSAVELPISPVELTCHGPVRGDGLDGVPCGSALEQQVRTLRSCIKKIQHNPLGRKFGFAEKPFLEELSGRGRSSEEIVDDLHRTHVQCNADFEVLRQDLSRLGEQAKRKAEADAARVEKRRRLLSDLNVCQMRMAQPAYPVSDTFLSTQKFQETAAQEADVIRQLEACRHLSPRLGKFELRDLCVHTAEKYLVGDAQKFQKEPRLWDFRKLEAVVSRINKNGCSMSLEKDCVSDIWEQAVADTKDYWNRRAAQSGCVFDGAKSSEVKRPEKQNLGRAECSEKEWNQIAEGLTWLASRDLTCKGCACKAKRKMPDAVVPCPSGSSVLGPSAQALIEAGAEAAGQNDSPQPDSDTAQCELVLNGAPVPLSPQGVPTGEVGRQYMDRIQQAMNRTVSVEGACELAGTKGAKRFLESFRETRTRLKGLAAGDFGDWLGAETAKARETDPGVSWFTVFTDSVMEPAKQANREWEAWLTEVRAKNPANSEDESLALALVEGSWKLAANQINNFSCLSAEEQAKLMCGAVGRAAPEVLLGWSGGEAVQLLNLVRKTEQTVGTANEVRALVRRAIREADDPSYGKTVIRGPRASTPKSPAALEPAVEPTVISANQVSPSKVSNKPTVVELEKTQVWGEGKEWSAPPVEEVAGPGSEKTRVWSEQRGGAREDGKTKVWGGDKDDGKTKVWGGDKDDGKTKVWGGDNRKDDGKTKVWGGDNRKDDGKTRIYGQKPTVTFNRVPGRNVANGKKFIKDVVESPLAKGPHLEYAREGGKTYKFDLIEKGGGDRAPAKFLSAQLQPIEEAANSGITYIITAEGGNSEILFSYFDDLLVAADDAGALSFSFAADVATLKTARPVRLRFKSQLDAMDFQMRIKLIKGISIESFVPYPR